MDLPVRTRANRQRKQASSFHILLTELWSWLKLIFPALQKICIKGGSSHLERSGLKMELPTSNGLAKKKKKNLQEYLAAWVLVNSSIVKLLTTKSSLWTGSHIETKVQTPVSFLPFHTPCFWLILHWPEAHPFSRLPGQKPGNHRPLPSSTGISSHHTWLLPVYRNWTQVLMCARQAFYPLRHLSNRTFVILHICIVLLWENKHHLFGQFFVYIQDIPTAEIRLHLTGNKVYIMEKVISVCLKKRTWGHH